MIEIEHEGKKVKVVTAATFSKWRKHATIAFVLLTGVSVGSAYLGFKAGEDADNGIRENGQDAVYRSCSDRVELRITLARAIDDLRRAAVPPPENPKELAGYRAFLHRTEVPIETLLRDAAGHGVEISAPLGDVQMSVVRADGQKICKGQAEAGFEDGG